MENQELQENQFYSDDYGQVPEPETEKIELTPEQKKAKTRKVVTAIAYSIALLCMLAGLFVPLFRFENIAGFADIETKSVIDKMFLKYIPGVFNALLYPIAKKNVIPLPESGFLFTLAALDGEAIKFSTQMLALTVYVITCVLGLIMLIPVLFGNSSKRGYAVCAYVVEVLAALSVGYFIFFNLTTFNWGNGWTLFNFVIVLGGVLLAMMVQSICNKGGLGVSKIILLILSVLVFIFLVNVAIFPAGIGKVFDSLSKLLGCGETAEFAPLYTEGIFGLGFVQIFKASAESGLHALEKIFIIVGGLLTCVCLFNLAFDTLEVVTNSKYDKNGVIARNGGMSLCAILRYLVALLLAIGSIVLLFIIKDLKPGVYLYLVTAVILIQLIIAIVRAAVLSSKHKKATQTDTDEYREEQTDTTTPEFNEDLQLNETEDEEEGEDTIHIESPVYEDEYVIQKDEQEPEEEQDEEPEEQEYPQQPYYQPYYQPAYVEPEYDDDDDDDEYDEDDEEEYEDEDEPEYDEEEYSDEPEEQEEPEEEQPVYQQPARKQQPPAPAYEEDDDEDDEPEYDDYDDDDDDEDDEPPVRQEERTIVYNYRAIYNGPSDDFMDTLTDAEKIEFVQIFLEKTKGKIRGIPDYEIGKENKDFFPAVFIHINRARDIVSTRLLEKIYKHIDKH